MRGTEGKARRCRLKEGKGCADFILERRRRDEGTEGRRGSCEKENKRDEGGADMRRLRKEKICGAGIERSLRNGEGVLV